MALRYSELMRKLPKVVPPLSPTRAIRDAEQARQRVAAFLEQGDGRTMVLTGAGMRRVETSVRTSAKDVAPRDINSVWHPRLSLSRPATSPPHAAHRVCRACGAAAAVLGKELHRSAVHTMHTPHHVSN